MSYLISYRLRASIAGLIVLMGVVGFGRNHTVHAAPSNTFIVNSNGDSHDPVPGNGRCGVIIFPSGENICTLRAAIEEANALPGHDTITFAGAGDIDPSLTLGKLIISDDVTIIGYDSEINRTTVTQMAASIAAIEVQSGVTGRLEHVLVNRDDFSNANWRSAEACVVSSGVLTLFESSVQQCRGFTGGILSLPGSELNLIDSDVQSNLGVEGGGVKARNAQVTIRDTFFSFNQVGGSGFSGTGGGLFYEVESSQSSSLTVESSVFSSNQARAITHQSTAAGIYIKVDNNWLTRNVTISKSLFINNQCGLTNCFGGSIHSQAAQLTVTQSAFRSNQAAVGGGIYATGGGVTIENSTFSAGVSARGSAIYATTQVLALRHVTVTEHETSEPESGAIDGNRPNDVYFLNSIIGDQQTGNDCGDFAITNPNEVTFHEINSVQSDQSCHGWLQTEVNLFIEPYNASSWTHNPTSSSPLIGSADVGVCAQVGNIDQRGYGRTSGEPCDIGAVERNGVPTAVGLRDMAISSTSGRAKIISLSFLFTITFFTAGTTWTRKDKHEL